MFAIVTVSDSRSSGEIFDESGQTLKKLVLEAGLQIFEQTIVPDEKDKIKDVLIKYCDDTSAVDCVITTGGTGFCPRDVTPEVVRSLIHRDTPGITTALLMASLKITPMAMASRLISGIRHKTLIICFPGSPKACQECFAVVRPALHHCLNQVRGDLKRVAIDHCCTREINLSSVAVDDSRQGVAFRPRNSLFEMIQVHDALKIIRQEIPQCKSVVEISIRETQKLLGKVLAQDVMSSVNIPPFPASIKDGYAVISSEKEGPRKVLSLASTAGIKPDELRISSGFCQRISTGAPVPEGADSVVQVENTELIEADSSGEEVAINIKVKPQIGQDIRPIGCDIKKGECVLNARSVLNPSQLGIIASVGIKMVKVMEYPFVGLLSTGDEIIEAGSSADEGKIWDSNKTLLSSLLAKNNFEFLDFGIAKDEYSQVREKLYEALESHIQVLVTTGGVSMGEKDLIKRVCEKEFGAILHFGRVNMKPGKPTTFMSCDWKGSRKLIFGLPGNPVSTHVTFTLFVLPTLRALAGMDFSNPQEFEAKLVIPQTLKLDTRPEYARGICFRSGLETQVQLVKGSQRSSRLMSTNGADVLVLLPSSLIGKSMIECGDIVSAVPFD